MTATYEAETKIKVRDLQEGDLVDLQHCPFLSHHEITEYEYGEVGEIAVETADCHLVPYDNLGLTAGYDPDTELLVQRRQ